MILLKKKSANDFNNFPVHCNFNYFVSTKSIDTSFLLQKYYIFPIKNIAREKTKINNIYDLQFSALGIEYLKEDIFSP